MTDQAAKRTKVAPRTCKAIRVPEPGGLDAMLYQDVEVPALSATGLLVGVDYAGVNFIDTYNRTGLPGYVMQEPKILGREGAGTVIAVGDQVTGWAVGDRCAFLCPSAYAQVVMIQATQALPVQEGLSQAEAAAALLQGLTAHYLATSSYPIKAGDTVLVHAGGGGTGALLIQIAKLKGARVLTTVGSEEKAQIAREAGADEIIMYKSVDFELEVKKLTDHKGVACVYDGVGRSTWEGSLRSLQKRGTLVLFGNASGPVPPIDPLLLSKYGSLFVTRPTLFDHIADAQEKAARCSDLFGWLADGSVRLRVAKVFPLSDAAQAHAFLESRGAMGKVLIKCAEELPDHT